MAFINGKFSNALNSHQGLSNRISHSREFLITVNSQTTQELGQEWNSVSIFTAGSLGRFETGRKSDLDVFLLTDEEEPAFSKLREIRLLAKLIHVNTSLSLPEFSGDGRYLKVHSVTRIVNGTGDSNDDSENFFTTRLLLLLESKSIWNEDLRGRAIDQVLENYFKDGKGKKNFTPLFLLNDILRYWRTVCLNYERDRIAPTSKWWKKNLNLKFSRKLTVYSTVLAILTRAASTKQQFSDLAELVPLERLAVSLDTLGDESFLDRFAVFLDDYESFLAAKSYGEVDEPAEARKIAFKEKAERFGAFLDAVVMSPKMDASLRRYLLI